MFAPTMALSAVGGILRGAEAHRRASPRVFYITGGPPPKAPTPVIPQTRIEYRPSGDGIGLGTLVLGMALFGD